MHYKIWCLLFEIWCKMKFFSIRMFIYSHSLLISFIIIYRNFVLHASCQCVEYKMALQVYLCLHGNTPFQLTNCCSVLNHFTDVTDMQHGLRSVSRGNLHLTRTKTHCYGPRSFDVQSLLWGIHCFLQSESIRWRYPSLRFVWKSICFVLPITLTNCAYMFCSLNLAEKTI